MRPVFLAVPALAAALALAAPAQAASVGASVSTNGVGIDAGVSVTPFFGIRVDGATLSFDHSFGVDDIDYDADVELKSLGGIVDFYPFPLVGFRVSAGARLNWNKADVEATPNGPRQIGGRTYTPAQIGSLDGKVAFDRLAPYAGIGWTSGFFGTGLQFIGDLGVLYQGSPKVSLRATGGLAADPVFAADLERERQELEDDVEDFKWYPVIKIGVMYKF